MHKNEITAKKRKKNNRNIKQRTAQNFYRFTNSNQINTIQKKIKFKTTDNYNKNKIKIQPNQTTNKINKNNIYINNYQPKTRKFAIIRNRNDVMKYMKEENNKEVENNYYSLLNDFEVKFKKGNTNFYLIYNDSSYNKKENSPNINKPAIQENYKNEFVLNDNKKEIYRPSISKLSLPFCIYEHGLLNLEPQNNHINYLQNPNLYNKKEESKSEENLEYLNNNTDLENQNNLNNNENNKYNILNNFNIPNEKEEQNESNNNINLISNPNDENSENSNKEKDDNNEEPIENEEEEEKSSYKEEDDDNNANEKEDEKSEERKNNDTNEEQEEKMKDNDKEKEEEKNNETDSSWSIYMKDSDDELFQRNGLSIHYFKNIIRLPKSHKRAFLKNKKIINNDIIIKKKLYSDRISINERNEEKKTIESKESQSDKKLKKINIIYPLNNDQEKKNNFPNKPKKKIKKYELLRDF